MKGVQIKLIYKDDKGRVIEEKNRINKYWY